MCIQGSLKINGCHINHKVILTVVLLVQSLFILYQDNLKQGYFIDEIYSYGLANCADRPFLNYKNIIQDKWTSNTYFSQYLSVQENSKFNYKQVYNNQVCDVHPPFFYMVIYTICSFFPNSCSKWFGLLLNVGLFVATQLFLYFIAMEMLGNNFMRSLAIIVLYGGTFAAVNPATYIRMYMMLTLFATASLYFHVCLLKKYNIKMLILIGITTFLGCMTQYYFLILSFFVAVVFCCTYLLRKQWKCFLSYASTMIISVILMLVSFPAIFEHLFGGRNVGEKTLNNMTLIQDLPRRLFSFLIVICREYIPFPGSKYLCLFFLVLILVAIVWCVAKKNKSIYVNIINITGFFQFLIALVLTYIVISLAAYDVYIRYMYFLFPIITIIVYIFLVLIIETFSLQIKKQNFCFLVVVLLVCLSNYLFRKTDYLYCEQYRNAKTVEAYANCPALFFVMQNSQAALTQECGSLMKIREVYCTDEHNVSKVKTILADKEDDSILVWVDINKYWSSGYDSKKL